MKTKFLLLVMVLIALFTMVACNQPSEGGDGGTTKVSIFSRPVVERLTGGKRKDWNDVSSFVCYYGDFDIEFQSKFDVVIMHSNTLYQDPEAKEKVKQLQDAGCYIVSYITIGEDDSLNVADGLGEGGLASYYVYENGAPKMNTNWNSYFVDAGNPVWQAKIIEEAGQILDYGVDGLFMDTLDTVDIDIASLPGMADLVKKLKTTYPEAKLVANRGFTVLPYISAYIDGLMFESFNTTIENFEDGTVTDLDETANEWNETMACNTINAVRRYDYFPVFALDYVNEFEYSYMPKVYYNRSWEYDFIPYNTYDIHLATPVYPKDSNGNLLTPTSERGKLALSKLTEGSTLGNNNADTTEANLAFVDNGVKVSVSSTFAGYGTKALNDGWYATPDNHYQNNWAKESWASMDNKTKEHWIEFEFQTAQDVSQVVVHWANDNDTYYSPKLCIVQAWINGEWVDVCTIDNSIEDSEDDFRAFEETWSFEFETVNTTKIRILQPKNCGAHDRFGDPVRPGIMWVSEVEIFEEVRKL